MSMHLHHASLSLNGKKKGPQKFRSAAQAQQHREDTASWNELQKRWGVVTDQKRQRSTVTAEYCPPKVSFRGAELLSKPSLRTGAGSTAKVTSPQYTGDKVKGIGTMHKSNAVPIFSDEEAVEISQMRRG